MVVHFEIMELLSTQEIAKDNDKYKLDFKIKYIIYKYSFTMFKFFCWELNAFEQISKLWGIWLLTRNSIIKLQKKNSQLFFYHPEGNLNCENWKMNSNSNGDNDFWWNDYRTNKD